MNEQQEILDHIRKKSGEIDQAIVRAEHEIELILEYRARLVLDVVTGQVDVQGIEVPGVDQQAHHENYPDDLESAVCGQGETA